MKRRWARCHVFSPGASAAALITSAALLLVLQESAGHKVEKAVGCSLQRLARLHAPERDAPAAAVLQEQDESLSTVSQTPNKRGGWRIDRSAGWKPVMHDSRIGEHASDMTVLSAPTRSMVLRL